MSYKDLIKRYWEMCRAQGHSAGGCRACPMFNIDFDGCRDAVLYFPEEVEAAVEKWYELQKKVG